MNPVYSLVIPIYNEEAVLPVLLRRLDALLGKLDAPAEDFDILLPLAADRGDDRFQLKVNYYYCQIAGGLCKAGTAAWDIPVAVTPEAQSRTILLEHHAR